MDGISLLEASILYTLLFCPLLSMVLLFFWTSANMKKTAKVQLLGLVFLLAIGFLTINSSISLVILAITIVLFVVWMFVYRDFFLKGQLPVIFFIFGLHVLYYILFFVFIGLQNDLAITLLTIIPILSMILLYPWTFGKKKTSNGRVFIMIALIIQVIYAILNITLSLMTIFN